MPFNYLIILPVSLVEQSELTKQENIIHNRQTGMEIKTERQEDTKYRTERPELCIFIVSGHWNN